MEDSRLSKYFIHYVSASNFQVIINLNLAQKRVLVHKTFSNKLIIKSLGPFMRKPNNTESKGGSWLHFSSKTKDCWKDGCEKEVSFSKSLRDK